MEPARHWPQWPKLRPQQLTEILTMKDVGSAKLLTAAITAAAEVVAETMATTVAPMVKVATSDEKCVALTYAPEIYNPGGRSGDVSDKNQRDGE